GVSVRASALALHVPYSRLREIVDGNRGLSADTALRLERFFGSQAQGWLALQAAYDLHCRKQHSKTIMKQISPLAIVVA
ncbi:MAG: addiction module antidote protein, HigA family, partial [Betaproteobacteria bacterium]|nr:addiction module antidote protein, HigA family [Betaproteobacteria bacterium]